MRSLPPSRSEGSTDPAHVKAGKQSAVIKTKGRFHPVQFTTGVPHRLTAWVKSAVEAEIKVEPSGFFACTPLKSKKPGFETVKTPRSSLAFFCFGS